MTPQGLVKGLVKESQRKIDHGSSASLALNVPFWVRSLPEAERLEMERGGELGTSQTPAALECK